MPAASHRLVRTALAAAVTLAALALASCGSDERDDAGGGAGQRASLTIKDFTFAPDPLAVPAGARLTVTNEDDAAHTVTADDGAFDSGNIAGRASTAVTVPSSGAGEVAYKCSIHDYMRGVIRVGG